MVSSPLTPDQTTLPLLLIWAQSNPMFRNLVARDFDDFDVQQGLLRAADPHVVDHVGKILGGHGVRSSARRPADRRSRR